MKITYILDTIKKQLLDTNQSDLLMPEGCKTKAGIVTNIVGDNYLWTITKLSGKVDPTLIDLINKKLNK